MAFVRIVSRDEWNEVCGTSREIEALRILFWQDPGSEDSLNAQSHDRKVCPVIEIWRTHVLRRTQASSD